jgi:hypothetical protein
MSKRTEKKLYRCPTCGDVLTETEYEASFLAGGNGYCLCQFSAVDEKGENWFPRMMTEYDVYILQEDTKGEKVRR